jgi:hypothetical protein
MKTDNCKFKWDAPYLWPPDLPPGTFYVVGLGRVQTDRKPMPQTCSLRAGHHGPHRSLTNVTKGTR